MTFPIRLSLVIESHNGQLLRTLVLRGGLTVILGPNGSGKTHLLRGLKNGLSGHTGGKLVRFMSAGRIGAVEPYRSISGGHVGSIINYDSARFGSSNDTEYRHQEESLEGDFQTLSARPDVLIKVQERLRKLFQRDVHIEWDDGRLKILFNRIDGESKPYSAAREASGLLQLVGVLSALYDDQVGALLLDEPEVSLHPQLQAFLLREILEVAGDPSETRKKLVVIATHSTEFLRINKPADLQHLVFCSDLQRDPVQVDPEADELRNRKLVSLVARLGQEHKLALFSSRPLLVEGPL